MGDKTNERYHYVFSDSDEEEWVVAHLTEAEAAIIQARFDTLNADEDRETTYYLDAAEVWTAAEINKLLTGIENGRKDQKTDETSSDLR